MHNVLPCHFTKELIHASICCCILSWFYLIKKHATRPHISQTVLFSQLIYERSIITIFITLQLRTPTDLFFSILLHDIHFPCVHISADFKYSMLLYMQIALLSHCSVALCLPWLEAPSLQCRPPEQILSWIMQLKDHHHRWVSLLYTE